MADDAQSIGKYYDGLQGMRLMARLFWGTRRMFFHLGYFDEGAKSHSQALIRCNQKMAEGLDLSPGKSVLDAGCGWGENSIWLAETYGVQVHGITLSPKQAEAGNRSAKAKGLSHLVKISVLNYHDTGLPDQSFDYVWFQEANTHGAASKYYREFYRLLKPGGMTTETLYWRYSPHLNESDEQELRNGFDFGRGFGIPPSLDEIKQAATENRFRVTKVEDWHAPVMRAIRTYKMAYYLCNVPLLIFNKLKVVEPDLYHTIRVGGPFCRSYERGIWTVGQLRCEKLS